MDPDLTSHFRFLYSCQAYPPFRVNYSRLENFRRKFDRYSGYLFEPDFGAGWKYHIEALDFEIDHYDRDDEGCWYYEGVTSGMSKSLGGAYQAVKGALPKETWPFISHQLLGRREAFSFAHEFELAHGPLALHEEMESGWLEKYVLTEATLEGHPPYPSEEP